MSAVKWDDDGVETRQFPMITEGRLVNYAASRHAASELDAESSNTVSAPQSYGCAVAGEAGEPVAVRVPHVTVAPSKKPVSIEDLCKDIPRGLLVRDMRFAPLVDQQFTSVAVPSWNAVMFEIERGTVVRRITGNELQFPTAKFFKSLTALGDERTVRHSSFNAIKGQPWSTVVCSTTAPAGLFKDVNVIGTRFNF
jgi:TldD protein